jgi:hypothetical protein
MLVKNLIKHKEYQMFATTLKVLVEDGVVQSVEGLPKGWTYLVDDNNVSGFEIGIYKKEKENEN